MSGTTSEWRADQVARLAAAPGDALPAIPAGELVRMVPGHDVWDIGPVWTPAGRPAAWGGSGLWTALSAPARGDPGLRHDIARLRLVAERPGGWEDLGPLFPEGASLGSREWAAHAVYDAAQGALEVLYTAVGGRDGTTPRFAQRIATATARVVARDGRPALVDWTPHREVLGADGDLYQRTDADDGEPGFIKAFRDPCPFRDPADGREWLLFAASLGRGALTSSNGAVGIARATDDGGWALEPPLLQADGVNNELERPHVVVRDGRYLLFVSTQRRTFARGVSGPTGLYGFVAPSLRGPYAPLNGSGLVLRNPDEEPYQAYSWLVLPDLRVVSFVDFTSLGGRTPDEVAAAGPEVAREHFGGTIAPVVRLRVDGASAGLDGPG